MQSITTSLNTCRDEQYQWMWQSNSDPWGEKVEPEYASYPFDENQIIESAFKNGKADVIINENYKIDLRRRIQINLNNSYKQRPVIRQLSNRENRRLEQPIVATRSFREDINFHGCQFVVDWYRSATAIIEKGSNQIVEAIIKGLCDEANVQPDREKALLDAETFVKQLRQVQYAKRIETVQETCIKLYTEESFLCYIVNQVLRDNDKTKSTALGPLCYLLYNYIGHCTKEQAKLVGNITLYRGERLSPSVMQEYIATAGLNAVWRWTQFVSTSKKREVAEKFSDGNVLFVIHMVGQPVSDQGVCVSLLSRYPEEEEVLLRPGVRFKIIKTSNEEETQKRIFHLEILPSYISQLHCTLSTGSKSNETVF